MIAPRELAVLVRSGVLRPVRPDRIARQLVRLRGLGPTLAGGYAVAAARAPHHVAVIDATTSRTFGELHARATAIAAGLAARGVGPGESVALLGHNSVAFVEALVAVNRTGADAVLLSTLLSPAQACDVVAAQRARLVVVDDELAGSVTGTATDVMSMETLYRDLACGGTTPLPPPPPPPVQRRGRLVVLTSGTTGTPKGARRPPPASLSPAASVLSRLPLRGSDRIMIAPPLFHTWGLGILQLAPALGATVVLRARADAHTVLHAAAAHRCTAVVAVPAILDRMVRAAAQEPPLAELPALRVVASSGSALTPQTSAAFRGVFGDVLYNVYGSTENSWATIADPADLAGAPGTAGRPPAGTVVRVLDEEDRGVAPGMVGRIVVGNDLPFEGYTDGTDRPRAAGLMATGDMGYIDPAGRLMVVGREDDLVITGAEKVYPLEVEQVIERMPGVHEVCVAGVADADLGQRLVAWVIADEAYGLSPAVVQAHVRSHLARFAVPKDVHFVASLPRTPTGKVMRRVLTATD